MEVTSYLGLWGEDVDDTNEGNQRNDEEPEKERLPERHRLHETHFRSEPDVGKVLLAVGMRHELLEDGFI